MILLKPYKRYTDLLMLTYVRKLFRVRWIQLWIMKLERYMIILISVNLWDVNGSSRKTLA
jgi:hypothetical protein